MRVPRFATHGMVVALLPFALAGCGLLGGGSGVDPDAPPPEDAAAKARERVGAYLEAMTVKDVVQGRAQLCEPLFDSFDSAATSPNGDFADHFTIARTMITDVRADGGSQRVGAAIEVTTAGRSVPINLVFTVTKVGDRWCIADEVPDSTATPTPSAS